jgi:hypothetical protein
MTDGNGEAVIDLGPMKNIEHGILKVAYLGYDEYKISLDSLIGKSITVFLAPYEVLTEDNILFTYFNQNGDRIVTGPFFLNKKKQKVTLRIVFNVWPWKWHGYRNTYPDGTIFVKK